MTETIIWRESPFGPCVTDCGGVLMYGILVESGHASYDFDFVIEDADLQVLKTDPARADALYWSLTTCLQKQKNDFTQDQMNILLRDTLHSSAADFELFLDRFSAAHHIALRVYIERSTR